MKRPIRDCGMFEAVLWLSGALTFLTGVIVAVLSVKPWTWGGE